MSIASVNPIAAAPAPQPPAATVADRAVLTQPAAEGKPIPAGDARRDELEQFQELAQAANMDVRVLDLPDDRVVVYRLVEAESGRLVREFPSEDLTRQLAALRALRLDERA